MDIRVGKIIEVSKHPEADALYIEKIDVGMFIILNLYLRIIYNLDVIVNMFWIIKLANVEKAQLYYKLKIWKLKLYLLFIVFICYL